MATVEDIVKLGAQAQEIIKRVGNNSLDPGIVRKIFQGIIEQKPPAYKDTSSTTVLEASTLMGSNFHGIEDVERCFKVKFSGQRLNVLVAKVPFSAKVLAECAETHLLVAGIPLRLEDMAWATNGLYRGDFVPWYENPKHSSFAELRLELGWHLVRKSALPGSLGKSPGEQYELLGSEDYIPSAGLVVYAALLHAETTGERILPDFYVYTTDELRVSTILGGRRVLVGQFASNGLLITSWHGSPRDYIGLATARKSTTR